MDNTNEMELQPRHSHMEETEDTYYVSYFGYAKQVLPCTSNDTGQCAYLDAVYVQQAHTNLYTFILWGVLLGVAAVWLVYTGWRMGGPAKRMDSWFDRMANSLGRVKRRYLIQDSPMRFMFRRVSRLQLVVLAIICIYLTIFS